MEKNMELWKNYQNLIYYGKTTMVSWKKLWYYTTNHGTIVAYS